MCLSALANRRERRSYCRRTSPYLWSPPDRSSQTLLRATLIASVGPEIRISPDPAGSPQLTIAHASFSHFCMKLFFAAPARALPFLSTALVEQASRLHFRTKLVFAAPVSAFPFLSTALLRQVSCATATLKPSVANTSVI